jgi:hypothetical protein
MTDGFAIEDVTGQNRLCDAILAELDRGPRPFHLVRGGPGAGKSWLLDEVGRRWEEMRRPTLYLVGDAQHSKTDLFPFTLAISRLDTGLARARAFRTAFAKAFAGVPIGGTLLEFIALQIANSREAKKTKTSLYLNELEREVVFHLQRLASNNPLLVLADNLHHFDEASARLLRTLGDGGAVESYPFVSDMRLVCAVTDGASLQEALPDLIQTLSPRQWRLDFAAGDRIEGILRAMGVGIPLPPEIVAYCAEVSGGHLEVLRLIADCLANEPSQTGWLLSEDGKAESFVEELIERRVRGLGQEGQRVIALLQHLAVAGSTFGVAEMNCLLSEPYSNLAASIDKAKEIDLLRESGKRVSFTHEKVQHAFLKRLERTEPAVHEKFAECIGRLRPGDYASRVMHYDVAGNPVEASHMRFLRCLQRIRSGDLLGGGEINAACLGASPDEARCYRAIMEGWRLLREGKAEEGKAILEDLSEIQSPLVIAEKDYLFARCAKVGNSALDRGLIRALLARWRDMGCKEFEQWFRLVSILMVLEADEGDFLEARCTGRILAEALAKRVSFDPFAKSAAQILNRRAATLFSAEIAERRCREAVVFFDGGAAEGEAGTARNPMQLYLARSNHSANLTMLGRFGEAILVAKTALQMRAEHPGLAFPRPEVPLNNLVLAGLHDGQISAVEAREALERALPLATSPSDWILLSNNLAVVKAMCGATEEGIQDLARMRRDSPMDTYHSYFVTANLICLEHLLGRGTDSEGRWMELQEKVPKIPESERIALQRRHEMLLPAFGQIKDGDFNSWWRYLAGTAPGMVGSVWRFYGWGLLLSDIQFWSEA